MQAGVRAGQTVIAVMACRDWLWGAAEDRPWLWEVGAVGSLEDLLRRVERLGLPGVDTEHTTGRCAVLLGRLHKRPTAWLSKFSMPG